MQVTYTDKQGASVIKYPKTVDELDKCLRSLRTRTRVVNSGGTRCGGIFWDASIKDWVRWYDPAKCY